MNDITQLKYKIDSFDEVNKIVRVSFEDGQWAQVRLSTPLPTTIQELENQIKMYAPTVEHLQAQSSNANLSFITSNIGVDRTCERKSLNPNSPGVPAPADNLDPEELYRVQMTIAIQRTLAEMAGATV